METITHYPHMMREILYILTTAVALGAALPADAAPRVITKEEQKAIRKYEKQKKAESKDKKKILKDIKKRATVLKKELAHITPIPMPTAKVAEDQVEALEQAAKEGDAEAMVQLGHFYMSQEKTPQVNKKKAGEYFHRAAESGNADAVAWSAIYDFFMMEGKNDLEKQKAARQKCCEAAKKVAAESCMAAYLAGLMSDDDAEKKQFYEQSARAGFVPAMRALGEIMLAEYATDSAVKFARAPEDVAVWLELAFKNGDMRAAMARSNSNYMHRSNSEEDTDTAEAEKWLRQALPLALAREEHWFGLLFDSTQPSPFTGAWGGERMFGVLSVYGRLVRVKLFDSKNPADVLRECCNTIKKMAEAGEPDAMAAAVLLPRKWSFWMGLKTTDPGILNEKEWLAKLKEKANAGDPRAARALNECNKLK